MNILDHILLNKETKNLIKINRIAEKVNSYMDKTYLKELKNELLKIKTSEHKDKIDLYLDIINLCLK